MCPRGAVCCAWGMDGVGLGAGWDAVVGVDEEEVVEMADGFDPEWGQRDVFGSGDAGERIVELIGWLR